MSAADALTRREWCLSTVALGLGFAWAPAAASAGVTPSDRKDDDTAEPDDQPGFHTPRADGRFVDTLGFLHALVKANPPKLAYDPALSKLDFERWRERVRARLSEVLSLPVAPQRAEARMIWSQPRDGYELQKWEAYPEPFAVAPFLVLVPHGVDPQSPAPAVMCFPGSPDTKEVLVGEPELINMKPHRLWTRNRMAQDYARAGLVAVAMDNPGVGELAGKLPGGWDAVGLNAMWLGRSFEGVSVCHKQCVLAWLKQQPFVRADRVALSGHSLGAKPALSMAVLDESIAALVYNDALVDWRRRAIATNLPALHPVQYVPGLIAWFDYLDLVAAIAPRPVLAPEGARLPEIQKLQSAWRHDGHVDRLRVVQQPKFADPAHRRYDDQLDLPEGLSYEQWQQYANVDPQNHYFKSEIAVPWLVDVLYRG